MDQLILSLTWGALYSPYGSDLGQSGLTQIWPRLKSEQKQQKSFESKPKSKDFGASGDIGFTPKASNTNGLRAIKQQYLHQNRISALDFEDVPVMGRPFFLPKSRVEKASPLSR